MSLQYLICPSCSRRMPRAALRCPWCNRPRQTGEQGRHRLRRMLELRAQPRSGRGEPRP